MASVSNYVNGNTSSVTTTTMTSSPDLYGVGNNGPATVIYVPMVTTTAATNNVYYERYQGKQSFRLGIAQVIIGILCIILNAVGIGFSWNTTNGAVLYIGHGFWSGILFMITGSLGISAAQSKTRCKIVGFMVTCILSACCAAPLLALGVIGAVIVSPNTYGGCYFDRNMCTDKISYQVVLAMQALMAILALTEAILATWGSALCCRAMSCCTTLPTQQVAIPQNYLTDSNCQVLFINQSQAATPYMYSQSSPYTAGQGGPVAPPSYQTSFAQPPWIHSQSFSSPSFYPSAPTYDASTLPSYSPNPPTMQNAEPPKY